MTTPAVPPPWLWKKGQPSPNPSGRPKGIVDRRVAVNQVFAEDAENIARQVVARALEGDLQACALVLARLSPVLKARAEKVTFTLRKDLPLAEQAASILEAVSRGEVDPETGKVLIDSLKATADLKVEELEARIAAIEQRAGIAHSAARGGVLQLASSEGKLCD